MADKVSLATLSLAKAYTDEKGGGGGGTSNYNDLTHLPTVNGVEFKGTMTGSDLGLVNAETGKGLSTNDYSNADKTIVDGVTSALEGKVNKSTFGGVLGSDGNVINLNENIEIFNSLETGLNLHTKTTSNATKYGVSAIPTSDAVDGEFSNIIIAQFNAITSFAVGDYTKYEGKVYKCTTAHTGAWDSSDFTQVKVLDEVKNLNTNAFPRDEQAVLGAKNFFNPQIFAKYPTFYTVNGDEVTASQDDSLNWTDVAITPLKAGRYILSRTNTEGATYIRLSSDSYATTIQINSGVSEVAFTLSADGGIKIKGMIGGWTYPATSKFMIRLASDSDDTFASYSMTNKELTEKQSVKRYSVSTASGYTISTNQVYRSGNVVNVFLQVTTPSDLSMDNVIGQLPFKPATSYAFLNAYETAKPYIEKGKIIIRQTSGDVLVPTGINITGSSFYVFGTYICQE